MRLRVWALALVLWLLVVLSVLLAYADVPPLWVLGVLGIGPPALLTRSTRVIALLTPVTGVWVRSPTAPAASLLTAVGGLVLGVAVVGMLDEWSMQRPLRSRLAATRAADFSTWALHRLRLWAGSLGLATVAAAAWTAIAGLDVPGGPWAGTLAPVAVATAAAAALWQLWWRPRRDSNPRPPP